MKILYVQMHFALSWHKFWGLLLVLQRSTSVLTCSKIWIFKTFERFRGSTARPMQSIKDHMENPQVTACFKRGSKPRLECSSCRISYACLTAEQLLKITQHNCLHAFRWNEGHSWVLMARLCCSQSDTCNTHTHIHFLCCPLFSSPRRSYWRAVQYIINFKILSLFNRKQHWIPLFSTFLSYSHMINFLYSPGLPTFTQWYLIWNACKKKRFITVISTTVIWCKTSHPNLEPVHHN